MLPKITYSTVSEESNDKLSLTNNATVGHISRGTRHRLKTNLSDIDNKNKSNATTAGDGERDRPQDHNVRSAVTECAKDS